MKTFTPIIALITSAIAFFYGTGLHPHWWMTWLAAVPVLAYAYSAPTRSAAAVAFFAFLLGEMNLLGYFKVLEIPMLVRCLALVGTALAFTAGVMLSRSLFRRGRYQLALIALPVLWEAFEFAMAWGRNGTALNLSYSQMDCLPLLQLASITGIWGIGFFVFLISSILAQLIALRKLSAPSAFTPAAVFIAIFIFGTMRLTNNPGGSSVSVGLAASDQRPLLGNETQAVGITESYAKTVEQLAKQGAGIIVLPEKIFTTVNYQASDLYKELREAAIRHAVGFVTDPGRVSLTDSIVIVAGVDQQGTPLKHNFAFALSPLHEFVYEKHHMVVGWEDGYEVGTTTVLLPPPNQNVGVQICKDMDFPPLSRTYGKLGAQLMLVPAWDFEIDDWLHSRMAIMRGVESGFAIARSAKQGFMTLSDNRGRVLSEKRSAADGDAQLIGTIRLSPDQTIYLRFGDWFAYLNLATLLGLLYSLLRKVPLSPPLGPPITDKNR